MSNRKLFAIAARQYGCVSRRQGLEVVTPRQWDRSVSEMTRVHPSVYLVEGLRRTWHQKATAALLSIDGAALSHRAAARFCGLHGFSSPLISITVPTDKQQQRDRVDVHRSEQLEPFVLRRSGMRVTTVARTLVDLSTCLPLHQLAKAVDWVCNQDLVKLNEIEFCMDRMQLRGRSRISLVRKILTTRTSTDEKLDSMLERRVLGWLRSRQLPEPEAHRWLAANGTRHELDLTYPEIKLAIEPDGPHHLLPSVAEYDRRRDADLELEGWIVLHVSPLSDQHEVIAFIRTAFGRRLSSSKGIHLPLQ